MGTLSRSIGRTLASASAAEHTAEDISENISHIPAEIKTAKPSSVESSGSALLKGSMTKLVILRFLFRIT